MQETKREPEDPKKQHHARTNQVVEDTSQEPIRIEVCPPFSNTNEFIGTRVCINLTDGRRVCLCNCSPMRL